MEHYEKYQSSTTGPVDVDVEVSDKGGAFMTIIKDKYSNDAECIVVWTTVAKIQELGKFLMNIVEVKPETEDEND